LAGANNLTIQEFQQRQKRVAADLSKAKEWWLPNLYAGTTFHQLWGNVMNGDGQIFTDVNRQNFWGGVGLNANWDFGDGLFKVDAAEFNVQAAAYETQAEKNKALLEVIQTYYDFLTAQLYYNAYQELIVRGDSIINQIAAQVDVELRFESELLLAKSNQNRLKVEMLNARTEYNDKSALLVKLLNLSPDIKLVSADAILAPLELVNIDEVQTPIDSAYAYRPELKSMEFTLKSLNAEKKTTTTGLWLPDLRVGTYGSYFGGVFSPLNPTRAVNAALIWEIPLGRIAYKGELKQFDARISLQEIKMEQAKATINEEVLRAKGRISTSKEQIDLALEGSQLAEQALSQSIARQDLKIPRPFEIVQMQDVYIRSKLDYIKAVATYNKAQYAYLVASGTDL
ncbi:MAG: TolC family protein, partial [Crocinitomicaceae bacterium]|nr:TolC family protein [Crocinitomicaceae bacterium]